MNREPEFSRFYKILGAEPGCSWREVRQAYRRQAQSWHPDRFPESSPERAEAEKKFVRINRAYQVLGAYWKQFGELPGQKQKTRTVDDEKHRTPGRTTGPPSQATTSRPTPTRKQSDSRTERRARPSEYRAISLMTLVALCVGVYAVLYWNPGQSVDSRLPERPSQTDSAAKIDRDLPRIVKRPRDDPSQRYFTVGSSMSKVNELQGIPERIEGETWVYGTSKVHFVDGLVASWEIGVSDPLYAMQTYDSDEQATAEPQHSGKIVKGATKADVQAIQGKPLFQSEDVWEYRVSRIYFKDGKVVGWHNSPLDPLKINGDRSP